MACCLMVWSLYLTWYRFLISRVLWHSFESYFTASAEVQYIPRNMHTFFALLCFIVVIHWLIFPCPPGLLHWHCGNLTIAPVPAKQPWWKWINTSCEFIMNDCITTTKQSTTKPCAYFLGYTVLKPLPGPCNELLSSLFDDVLSKCLVGMNHYSISQEICTRFLLCCALLWLYID